MAAARKTELCTTEPWYTVIMISGLPTLPSLPSPDTLLFILGLLLVSIFCIFLVLCQLKDRHNHM